MFLCFLFSVPTSPTTTAKPAPTTQKVQKIKVNIKITKGDAVISDLPAED